MTTIFISHASADKIIIDDFFDLLQTGCDLRRKEIFCSSVEGAGIKTGEDFVRWIQKNMYKSELVILFFTPNYFDSRFCVAEMGAAWALRKNIFPIVIPNIDRDAGAVLIGKQTEIVNETGLDELRDRIAEHHDSTAKATSRWSLKKAQFLKKFREKLPKLPVPAFVDQSLLEQEKEKVVAAMEMNDELTEKNNNLREQIKLLEKAKDAIEVKKIKAVFSDKDQHYDELVKRVNKHLEKLTVIEVRCVYASIRNESWVPDKYDYREYGKEIEKTVQREWIEEHESAEGLFFEANVSHPHLIPVFDAINELDDFIKNKLSDNEKDKMAEELGYYINLQNREYWEEELDQGGMLD